MSKILTDAAPVCRRHDHVFAAYVNAALTVQKHIGTKKAEEFLAREGVPGGVATRVLRGDGPQRARGSHGA